MKKRWIVLGIATAMVVTLSGMHVMADEGDTYKVGFFVKTLTNEPFMVKLSDRCQEILEADGHEYTVFSAGDQTGVATQCNQIEDAINSGEYDALIVVPVDSNAVLPYLQMAKDEGIPVCVVDTPIPDGNEDLILSFIGTDNYQASLAAGTYVLEQLGGEGKVALIRGITGAKSLDDRVAGYEDAVAAFEGVEIVADQPGYCTNADAMEAMENILQSNPEITCVLSVTDVMIDGILSAIENEGRDDILICSFDGNSNATQLILDGKVTATAGQYPTVMGEKACEFLLGYLNGTLTEDDIPNVVDSGAEIVVQDNAEAWLKDFAF